MRVLAILCAVLCVSCHSSVYVNKNPDNLSFAPTPKDYKFVRQSRVSKWEHYWLLNFISAVPMRDVSELVPLQNGEKCFNLRVQNAVGPGQFFAMAGAFVVTTGLSGLVWSTRKTEVVCDVAVPEAIQPPAPTTKPS